jgi:hypothetical protein
MSFFDIFAVDLREEGRCRTMNLDVINKQLREPIPDNFILQSFTQEGRILVIAFTCADVLKEDQAFLVTFNEAFIFHVPSVLYHLEFQFEAASLDEIRSIIPPISFGEEDFGESGFTLFVLTDTDGKRTGYYVVAECVTGGWVPREQCVKAW